MAGRGIYLSLALVFALLLVNISFCTCKNEDTSDTKGNLTKDEAVEVYKNLEALVDDIKGSAEYYAGRLFYKNLNINGKPVLIRLTRLSGNCSVSMSETSTGSELVEAFTGLLKEIHYLLVVERYDWAALTIFNDWIDYYVTDRLLGSAADARAAVNSTKDCPIPPQHFLLSHSDFHQLKPGDSLFSPNGKYKLTIPPPAGRLMAICVLNLEDQAGKVIWQSDSKVPFPLYIQDNCYLDFGDTGKLELWNRDQVIWHNVTDCSPTNECIGSASLVVEDSGNAKVYRSFDHHLAVYWSAVN